MINVCKATEDVDSINNLLRDADFIFQEVKTILKESIHQKLTYNQCEEKIVQLYKRRESQFYFHFHLYMNGDGLGLEMEDKNKHDLCYFRFNIGKFSEGVLHSIKDEVVRLADLNSVVLHLFTVALTYKDYKEALEYLGNQVPSTLKFDWKDYLIEGSSKS